MPFDHNFPNFEKVELKFVPNGIQNHYKHTNPTIDPFKFWKKLWVTKLNMFFPYKLGQQWTPSMSKSPNPNTYKIDPSPHTHLSPHNFLLNYYPNICNEFSLSRVVALKLYLGEPL
jgi:hypothetical protein